MKGAFRQSMAWLHTWTGLAVGWVLFFIFLTGTLSYVRFEIDRWMMPEKPLASPALPAQELLPLAIAHLSVHAPDAERWRILLPARRTGNEVLVAWDARPGQDGGGSVALNPASGRPYDVAVRDTGGGSHLYEMHYSLHYLPYAWAIRLVGICSMFMLVGIVSGVVVHKKIFKDFFTFRPGKGQRSWLDAHNVTGVIALPFHLMITYSGLVLFVFDYMPAGPKLIYGDRAETFYEKVQPFFNAKLPERSRSAQAPISVILNEVDRRWSLRQVRAIEVREPGRANSEISFQSLAPDGVAFGRDTLVFSGVTAALTDASRPTQAVPVQIERTLSGLHIGDFAGPLLRSLYVLSGLASTALIGTGLVLWSVKRKAKLTQAGRQHFGLAIVDRLNIGTIVGLPIGIAAYFWANRLLSPHFPERHDWEVHVMFLTWAATLIYPIWRPLDRAWAEMLALAAVAYGFLPILNALTTNRHLGVTIPAGDWVLAGFDLIALTVGALFAAIAWKLHCKARGPVGGCRRTAPRGEAC